MEVNLKFLVEPIFTRIIDGLNTKLESEISELLKVRPENYYFYKSYKEGRWDGYFRFYRYKKFFTGLFYEIVLPYIKKNGIEFKIIRYKFPEVKNSYELKGIELRDYQKNMIETVLSKGRGIIQLPTNAGKTEVALGIVKAFGSKTLFVVNNKDLLYQVVDRYKLRGLGEYMELGIYGDGKKQIRDFTVTTIQSLMRDFNNEFKKVEVLILDECHHYTNNNWTKYVKKIPARVRIGLSATPLRDNVIQDWFLIGLTGPVISSISNKYLIELGYSVEPEIHMKVFYSRIDTSGFENYHDYYNALIMNPERNRCIVERVKKYKNKSILVLTDRISQGEILNRLIEGSVFINGETRSEHRLKVKERFIQGKVKVLITTLFDEGIDIPNIEVLVFASPFESMIKTLQRLGRGMRIDGKKKKVIVLDFIDKGINYFYEHSMRRKSIYEKEGFKVIYEE